MIEALLSQPPEQVTIIDDDPDERDGLMDELRDFNIEPIAVSGPYGADVNRMVRDVMEINSPFVVCDHRLQSKNFASFNGATLIQALAAHEQPAMLLTMFQSTNRLELREVRKSLPVVVNRDDFQVENMGIYSEICRRDLRNDPVDERRAHRVLIAIEAIDGEAGNPQLYVRIPSWRTEKAVTLPRACVHESILPTIKAGDYVVGDVNIGASCEDDLFFANVNEKVELKPSNE